MKDIIRPLDCLVRIDGVSAGELYSVESILKKNLQNALESLDNVAVVDQFNNVSSGTIFQDFELLLSILLKEVSNCLKTGVANDVISMQELKSVKEALFFFSFSSVYSVLDEDVIPGIVPWIIKFWPSDVDSSVKIRKLNLYLETVFYCGRTSEILKLQIQNYLLVQVILALETLGRYDPENPLTVGKLLETTFLKDYVIESVFYLLRNGKKSKGSEWFYTALNSRLNGYVAEKDGTKTMLTCMDNYGGEKFWHTPIPCNLVASVIFKAASKESNRVFKELKETILLRPNSTHFGCLLSLVVDKSQKSKILWKAMSTQILDVVCFPFDVLWERELEYHMWVEHFDKAMFLAQTLLLQSKINERLLVRMRKLFTVLLYINGHFDKEKVKEAGTNVEKVTTMIITAIDCYATPKDKAEFLLQCFKTLCCIKTVPVTSNIELHFGVDSLAVKPSEEILSDSFFEAAKTIFNSYSKAHAIAAHLLAKTMKLWNDSSVNNTYVRDFGRLESDGGTDSVWVTLHLMCNLGEWLADKDCFGDNDVVISILGVVKETLVRVYHQLTDFCLRQRELDIKTVFNESDLAKTAQLSLALLGGVYSQFASDEVKKLYDDCTNSASDVYSVIMNNMNLVNDDFKTLKTCLEQFLKLLGKSLARSGNEKNTSELEVMLEKLSTDHEDEEDGSMEMAERGHLVIKLCGSIKRHDVQVDQNSQKVFDVLTYNIKHADSYVYLSSVNALAQLVLWKHSEYLTKVMFLFRHWECQCEDEKGECESCSKGQVQLGEAISRVLWELGEVSAIYYDQLNLVFTKMLALSDDVVLSSALSGFVNLVEATKGKYLWKNFFELLFACQEFLSPKKPTIVRRASSMLLRTMLSSQNVSSLLQNNKTANSQLIKALKQSRSCDADEVVRLHADLALCDVSDALKQQLLVDSVEKNTRVLNL
ncbi:unnamed protein product [Bursaphelenchus okinawaensis]|uniref:RNA polymerase II assembly factor Rtp1 C-terminal domain-containing protein n=1 Tax=Bursaphelenchus okinawaensis TaxID=465554 RepID=A0A811JTT4_9BILA|nr:unnamed protein product [Bursaphelenchus okinawaensis]CAG9082694.1 unnamed protein product [Bursaphelenchus okinawaensis]